MMLTFLKKFGLDQSPQHVQRKLEIDNHTCQWELYQSESFYCFMSGKFNFKIRNYPQQLIEQGILKILTKYHHIFLKTPELCHCSEDEGIMQYFVDVDLMEQVWVNL